MNTEQQRRMTAYFDERIAACTAEVKAFELDHRQDEAIFAKIRLNVYDIFRTIFSVAAGRENGADFFLERLDQIPRNWQNSLTLAQRHGDSEKAFIERLKLDTAAEIRKTFQEVKA